MPWSQVADEVKSFPSLTLLEAGRLAAPEALSRLASSVDGLSAAEARHRLTVVGPNAIRTHDVRALAILVRQVRNPLLILLGAATLTSLVVGEHTNAIIIFAIVGMSVGLGFFTEYRSERVIEALHTSIRHRSLVIRDKEPIAVDVTELVPGDIVRLRTGDLVPADLRLIDVRELECDQAVLTGEAQPKSKVSEPEFDAEVGELGLRCAAYMGTTVRGGSGTGVVLSTGSATAFGKIAMRLGERQPETAFQRGLRSFSILLVWVTAVLSGGIFIANSLLGRPILESALFSLAIAVGLTPQLLPAIVTVSLASGARNLARKRVVVKRLISIEDLGNIEILFTDKTGTLTEGVITFERGLDADGQQSDRPLLLGLVCNEATVTDEGPVGGNALDQALWSAPGAAAGEDIAATAAGYQRQGVLPFDHERQLGSVLVIDPAGKPLLITKGAPEVVLDRCANVPDGARPALEALFSEGARVVAVAARSAEGMEAVTAEDEQGLALVGFLTFADRPKADAGSSIAQLERLGIEVKIITGDNGLVAAKVCSDIGVECAGVLSGTEVEALDDDQLEAAIVTTTVFARIGPDQKSRIIKVARRTGKDVAFLGDGVNDAVALHHADVGISVDSGTDVAKDAADVVLLDKDLGVLAEGVMEGRRIFANTMKYVLMSTSSNFGNMFSAAGASVFLSFLPMLPTQILLNNLLYNAGQLVIPTDRVDPEALARRGGLGHGVHPALHVRVRSCQLDLRLPHLLGDVVPAPRRPHRVQDWLVRRVDRHPDAGRLCHPDPASPVPPEST